MLAIEEVKEHLRLNPADTHEDTYLESLIAATHSYIEQYLNRSLPWKDSEGVDVAIPQAIKQAALLIIGDLYENREGKIIGVSSVDNPVVLHWLHLYRVDLGL